MKPHLESRRIRVFHRRLWIRERCSLVPVTEQAKSKEKRDFGFGFRPGQNRRLPPSPTSSTLFSNNEWPPLNKDKWCIFCNGPPHSTKCAVVINRPRSEGENSPSKGKMFWLFNLRSGHFSRDCEARCHRCGAKRHVCLCNVHEYLGYLSPARQAIRDKLYCGYYFLFHSRC